MTMISVNEFKNGLTIQYNNDYCRIVAAYGVCGA